MLNPETCAKCFESWLCFYIFSKTSVSNTSIVSKRKPAKILCVIPSPNIPDILVSRPHRREGALWKWKWSLWVIVWRYLAGAPEGARRAGACFSLNPESKSVLRKTKDWDRWGPGDKETWRKRLHAQFHWSEIASSSHAHLRAFRS